MKKTFLVLLVLSAVLFSAAAGGLHYGIESSVKYDFNLTNNTEYATNKAYFAFSPFIKGDSFNVRLLAEWGPDGDNAHGFDYLMNFNAENPYELTESILKYIDKIEIDTGVYSFYLGRGELSTIYKSNLSEETTLSSRYKAEAKIDAGVARIYVGTTDFEKITTPEKYNATQRADIVLDFGILEIEADAIHQAVYRHEEGTAVDLNRIIPKLGVTLKPGVVTVGVSYSTDIAFDEDRQMQFNPLDHWVLEAGVGLKLGFFNVDGTFFLNNQMPGYRSLKPADNKAMFGFVLSADADIADFVRIDIDALLPLQLNNPLSVQRDDEGNTLESIKASVEIGTWWRVGASVQMNSLISSIGNGTPALDIIKGAKPEIHAGIYTETFDLTAKATIADTDTSEIIPAISVAAAFRVDNFFSSVKK